MPGRETVAREKHSVRLPAPEERTSIAGQSIDIACVELPWICGGWPVEANVCPAKVVGQQNHDVRLRAETGNAFSRADNINTQGGNDAQAVQSNA